MSLQKLTGTIENLKCQRQEAHFVFTESSRNVMGVTALAAGIAGLSGQAIAMAQNAESLKEEADYLEFTLDGKLIKGWVWANPFRNGNEVEIAAEWLVDHFEAYAIARPSDRIIALYPHCSRGKTTHIKNAAKWWFFGTTISMIFCLGIFFLVLLFMDADVTGSIDRLIFISEMVLGFFYFVSGVFTLVHTEEWMKFVKIAERSFAALGWEKPSSIDLVKSTDIHFKKTPNRDRYLGVYYFKY